MEAEVLTGTGPGPGPATDPLARHRAPLWRYLRLLGADAATADDLAQETLLRAIGHAPADFTTLRRAARHLFLDRLRYEGRRARAVAWSQQVEEWVTRQPDAFEDARLDALRACLQQLGARPRRALFLRHHDGASQADIAAVLGLRLEGLKALLRRSRALLRECITRRLEGDEA